MMPADPKTEAKPASRQPKEEPPVECPNCGETNNWREINNGTDSMVYNCRCGGRIEVPV